MIPSLIAALGWLFALTAPAHAEAPLIFAAASLQESLTAAADAWAAKGHERPKISFAASSALARQIENGAPANIFISADQQWMDYLANRSLIASGSRSNFVKNDLVLVAPATQPLTVKITAGFPLATLLQGGKLAVAEVNTVPAGKYAKEALTKLGVWASVQPMLVQGDSVRSALAYVERGAARASIVYATDAKASRQVMVAGIFPANSHQPIVYPVGVVAGRGSNEARAFEAFLLSREGKAIFARFGFGTK
jgi:molybdate transport system substrate-binding protein